MKVLFFYFHPQRGGFLEVIEVVRQSFQKQNRIAQQHQTLPVKQDNYKKKENQN